jgi:DNA-directed RNA polymerase subunit RPC12/RpoP
VLLCNKCGLKYHKSQYCPYCRYIYGKETEKSPQVWLTCSSCGRWAHVGCEIEHGGNSTAALGGYSCPDCKQRHSEKFSSRYNRL